MTNRPRGSWLLLLLFLAAGTSARAADEATVAMPIEWLGDLHIPFTGIAQVPSPELIAILQLDPDQQQELTRLWQEMLHAMMRVTMAQAVDVTWQGTSLSLSLPAEADAALAAAMAATEKAQTALLGPKADILQRLRFGVAVAPERRWEQPRDRLLEELLGGVVNFLKGRGGRRQLAIESIGLVDWRVTISYLSAEGSPRGGGSRSGGVVEPWLQGLYLQLLQAKAGGHEKGAP